jgi:hypothetical protein
MATALSHSPHITVSVIKHIGGISYTSGGVAHSGWLPPGAVAPLPTPILHHTLDLAIEHEGNGYLLIFTSREDPSFGNDYWFERLSDAEATASEMFGVAPAQWIAED